MYVPSMLKRDTACLASSYISTSASVSTHMQYGRSMISGVNSRSWFPVASSTVTLWVFRSHVMISPDGVARSRIGYVAASGDTRGKDLDQT